MAKKIAVKKIEPVEFEDLHRGTSVTIPVVINKKDGTSFDLSDYEIHFTLKPAQYDYDYDDIRAYVSKVVDVPAEMAEKGRFNVNLSSKETWLTPGEYFFDIMLIKDHSVARLCLCRTNIVGGPTNCTVDDETGEAIFMTDALSLTPEGTNGLVFQTNLVSDPPEHMVETLKCDPPYLVQPIGAGEDPRRNLKLRVYGPRLSFPVYARIPHDANIHPIYFGNYYKAELPDICPIIGMAMQVKNREITIKSPLKEMNMMFSDIHIQHSPETTNGNSAFIGTTAESVWIGDNVDVGQIHWQLFEGNDVIDIDGNYFIEDDHGGYIYFMLTVNWYNWIDVGTYEEIPEDGDETETHATGKTYTSVNEEIWPPDIFYGEGWEKK